MSDSSIDADKQAIQVVLDRLFSSYKSRDLELMLSCYVPDVVTMMPFGEPTYGLDEWRTLLEGAFASGTVLHVEADTEEILINADWAFEWHSEWAQRMRIPFQRRACQLSPWNAALSPPAQRRMEDRPIHRQRYADRR